MANPFFQKSWSPYAVGVGIGMLSWFSFASVDHPLGISTAFEQSAALTVKAAAPTIERSSEYFANREAAGKRPKVDWEWMLVVGVFVGAFASSKLSGDRAPLVVSSLWRWRFGESAMLRLAVAFFSGGLMMFGARLAQGCTSGHGISGTLQFAVSSWLFISVAFAIATMTVFFLYGREGVQHV
ncbi:MAG: YeeE/YedE thiosulfate transporter family protein [Pirellulaceae bacterium]